MNGLHIEKKFYPTPCDWGKISQKKAEKILGILATETNHEEARIAVFFAFFGFFTRIKFKYLVLPLLSNVDRFDILRLTDWAWEKEIKKNLFPKIGKLYGMLSIEHLTLSEFSYLDNLLGNIAEKPENIDKILSILYRLGNGKSPKDKDFNGDYRQEFNPKNPFISLEFVKKFSPAQKLAAIKFLMYSKSLLPSLFPNVFTGGSEQKDAMIWAKVIRSLSNSVVDFDKTQNVSLLDALFELSERIEQDKKIENTYAK